MLVYIPAFFLPSLIDCCLPWLLAWSVVNLGKLTTWKHGETSNKNPRNTASLKSTRRDVSVSGWSKPKRFPSLCDCGSIVRFSTLFRPRVASITVPLAGAIEQYPVYFKLTHAPWRDHINTLSKWGYQNKEMKFHHRLCSYIPMINVINSTNDMYTTLRFFVHCSPCFFWGIAFYSPIGRFGWISWVENVRQVPAAWLW